MRIAIVEDDRVTRTQLRSYVEQHFRQHESPCTILEFSDGDEILEGYTADYSLIFLDIQMSRLDGMDTARRIRRMDEEVCIVFVTNLSNYAIEGYSVRAMDYVLKPVNALMLEPILERVRRIEANRLRRFITLPTDQGMARIDLNEVDFIETEGHRLIFHTAKGVFRTRETMKNMEKQLSGQGFFRCNNCYLVNLMRLTNVTHTDVTVGGQELTISRGKYKPLMDALSTCIGGIGG